MAREIKDVLVRNVMDAPRTAKYSTIVKFENIGGCGNVYYIWHCDKVADKKDLPFNKGDRLTIAYTLKQERVEPDATIKRVDKVTILDKF